MRKKTEEESHESSERWLVSYADFITLLMIFFVIMYAMSKVDSEKFYQLAQSLNSAFVGGTGTLETGDANTGTVNIDNIDLSNLQIPTSAQDEGLTDAEKAAADAQAFQEQETERLQEIEEQLAKYFIEAGLNDSILLNTDSRGLVISVNAAFLFDSGSAEIKPEMATILINVGEIINKIENYIRVEGHTDNVPIGNSPYKSNWELSAARATNVIEFFIENAAIPPQKLVAAGYSEYKPIASNDTAEGRDKNRRVDIIILSSKYNDLEDQLTDANQSKTPAQVVTEMDGNSNVSNTPEASEDLDAPT